MQRNRSVSKITTSNEESFPPGPRQPKRVKYTKISTVI